jgi:hypothetical protein
MVIKYYLNTNNRVMHQITHISPHYECSAYDKSYMYTSLTNTIIHDQTTGLLFQSGSEATVHSPEALVHIRGICGGQSGSFLRTLLFPCQYHSNNGPKSYFIHCNTNNANNLSKRQQSHLYVSMRKDI